MATVDVPRPGIDVTESIFLCSEKYTTCHHACQRHKIHWSHTAFLEDDIPEADEYEMDEALTNSITTIVDEFNEKTAHISPESMGAARNEFEEAIADAIVNSYKREYGIGLTEDEMVNEATDAAIEDLALEDREDLEAIVLSRLLGVDYGSDSSDDEDDDDDAMQPPRVRRRISGDDGDSDDDLWGLQNLLEVL